MLSALYYIFTLLQVTILFVVSMLVLIITYPFDKSRRWVHECSRLICALLYGVPFLMRRTIDGVENIDRSKSYVMVMNHNSGFDIFAAYKIPLNFRWVSKREVFRVPFMGPLLTIHGDIPIERGNAAEAMAKVLYRPDGCPFTDRCHRSQRICKRLRHDLPDSGTLRCFCKD